MCDLNQFTHQNITKIFNSIKSTNYEYIMFLECFVNIFARQYLAFGQGRELKN